MELKSPDMPSRGENRRNGTSGTDSKVLKPSTKAMEKLSDQAVKYVSIVIVMTYMIVLK